MVNAGPGDVDNDTNAPVKFDKDNGKFAGMMWWFTLMKD